MRTSKTAARGLAVLLCAVLSLWAIPAQVLADEPSGNQADSSPAASGQAKYPLRAGLAPGEGASLLPRGGSERRCPVVPCQIDYTAN